ncbi:MAG: Ku protein [Gemmatimonadales bacterium]
MAARAMWKGVIQCADVEIPVKLYAAVEDQRVPFRMLNRKDQSPVRQSMVHPVTGKTVPHERTRRAYIAESGHRVILSAAELKALEPEESRDIEILAFVPPAELDHRWYERPYYLGPDASSKQYFALTEALEKSGLEGVARWVMRGRQYRGALRLHEGYPVLMSLRNAAEVIPADALPAPGGPALDARELDMARQLIGMLSADLDLSAYHDEYRGRVEELLQTKARGGRLKLVKPRRKAPIDDLSQALQASLKAARKAA